MSLAHEQRAIFITGTSTGIGRACALHLDRLGFQVFATVRNDIDAENLRAEASDKLVTVVLDVTDESSIKAAMVRVREGVGEKSLYGLLNNAGIGTMIPFEYAPLDEIRRIFEVNVFGTMAVTQAMLPFLRRARGRVVNVSSMTSLLVMPYHGPYSASKRALNAFSDALRLELRSHGVHVSTVFPGFVITPTYDLKQYRETRAVVGALKMARDLYGSQYRKAMAFIGKRAKTGITAEEAARLMTRAFTDKRPRIRYFAGTDARLVLFLDPLLSGRLRDWVIMRIVGLAGDEI